ncbi:hypothetical protein FBZ33_2857 [Micromonospora sp. A202]|uniref:hypothetical protein n=1 Tax=Micromonospora sp. A202 TaxID=2572899 RepID=UPI00114F148D|nr:hypothetical protein [Micromonospora sp. A202]TQJ22601.1 hypothetical protein FBZ33_2857 [Micromonospora sp. A202]
MGVAVAGLAPAIVGGDPDGWEDAKNEMQRVIGEWDAPAMTSDNYWDGLSWDIATGNCHPLKNGHLTSLKPSWH